MPQGSIQGIAGSGNGGMQGIGYGANPLGLLVLGYSCQVTPPPIDCSYLGQAFILSLQDSLAALCPFFEYIYPVAEVGERMVGTETKKAKRFKYPRLYINGHGERDSFIDLSPDSDRFGRSTYCFFEIDDKETLKFDLVNNYISLKLNLIVWAKQDNITGDKRDITEYLIAKVKTAISKSYLSGDISALSVERDKHNVFNKYDYSFEKLRNIAWPYTCFKMVMNVHTHDNSQCVSDSCINPI